MNDWAKLIDEDWRNACGKTSRFSSSNYYNLIPEGQHVLTDGSGNLHLNLPRETFCLNYERIRQELDNSKTLLNKGLTKRCDYVLCDGKTFLLADITSSHSRENLLTDRDPRHRLTKFEKVELQLYQTLMTLRLAESVSQRIDICDVKWAVCAYTIKPATERNPCIP